MLPHQFRRLLETLRSQFGAIQEAIQNYQNSDANERSADRGEKRIETGTLREISNRVNPDHPTTTSRHEQTGRQQERLITAQVWMTRWTFCAFVAAGLTAIGAFWYACIANRQLNKMNDTYKEIRWQTYLSCLNTQTAQQAFLLLQKSALDSHASTVAAIKQASAGIEAQRAIIAFTPRIPTKSDYFFNDQFHIPVSVKNEGRSDAIDMRIWYKAVLLPENDALRINNKHLQWLKANFFKAGAEEPMKPENPSERPLTRFAVIRNSKEEIVKASSPEAQDFLSHNGTEMIAVYGHMRYSDFSGTHTVQFCDSQYFTKSGEIHDPSNSEKVCSKYNQEGNQYALPKTDSSTNTLQIAPITCVKPPQ
jgi:hypothetical protein